MEFQKLPTWVYGAGAAVVAFALLARQHASGATVATIGPVTNPNDAANLQARVSGFGQLTAFAGKLVDQGTTLAQTQAAMTTQVETAQIQSGAATTAAQINAETERARIGAAQATAATQAASSLAATRSTNRTSTINGIVSTVGKVVGSVFHLVGL